ncbi:MAG: AMP-binding protein [Burkholderiaceae bacterium]|jgi:acetyl-CoA synthetase
MNDQYPELYASYRWLVPPQFNIAQACLYRWALNPAEGRRAAIVHETSHGAQQVWTYAQLAETTHRLANGLQKMGVAPGDRVAIIMGQHPETAIALFAILSLGAVAVPLIPAMSTEQLAQCLNNAQVRVAILDAASIASVLQLQSHCPQLRQLIGLDLEHEATISWRTLLARQTAAFTPVQTRATDPALLLYVRKGENYAGVVLAHQALIGNLPGFVASQNWFPRPGDVFWTPLDWRLSSGLLCGLLPTLYFGKAIVSTLEPLSPHSALDLLMRYRVTNALLTPSILDRLLQVCQETPVNTALRAVALLVSAQHPQAPLQATHAALGVLPNVVFNSAETGCIVGMSHEKWPSDNASIGRPFPGHRVDVLQPDGTPCAAGKTGRLAVNRHDAALHPDPALFLGYWKGDGSLLDTTDAQGWHVTPLTVWMDKNRQCWLGRHEGDRSDIG